MPCSKASRIGHALPCIAACNGMASAGCRRSKAIKRRNRSSPLTRLATSISTLPRCKRKTASCICSLPWIAPQSSPMPSFILAPHESSPPDLRDQLIKEFKLPKGTQRIDAPTPYVWIIGRTKTDGPPDYDAVHKIQEGFKITPLSEWGKSPKPVEAKIDPSVDMKTPPKIQVDTMPAGQYI